MKIKNSIIKKPNKNNRIQLLIVLGILCCIMLTGCEKRPEFRHGHRHRIGDPPIEEQKNTKAEETVTIEEEAADEAAEEALEEAASEPEVFAFEGLDEVYHRGMELACEEIKADKYKLKNFVLMNSNGEKAVYRFEYNDTLFEANLLADGSVQYITTVPADGLLYRDGCKGLDIADFCIDKSRIPDIQTATEEAFEHGAIQADFEIDYFWDQAEISRVYDYYIVRVNGKAIYNYTERRTEPQVVCELKDVGGVFNPRYFSVQNGDRMEEYGQHEVPMCELEEK